MKLAAHWAGLSGNVISFHIVPLGPASKAGLAEHVRTRALGIKKAHYP